MVSTSNHGRRAAPRRSGALWLAAGALLALVVAACSSGGSGGSGGGQQAREVGADEVILTVTRGGEVLARWSVARMQAELTIVDAADVPEGQPPGPRLLDLLDASGAGGWSRLAISGQGPSRAFEVELAVESDAVDGRWVLSFARRGTVKLVADSLSRERWVRDVSEIEVVE